MELQPRVTLIGKPGCHLCEQARAVIAEVCNELQVSFVELSILENPQLADLYFELIPVTLVDGKVHDQLSVSAERLKKALS